MKNQFYFSHDYYAITDPKLFAFYNQYGLFGYGLYWRIVEMLHTAEDNKLELKDYLYNSINQHNSTSVEQIKEMLNYAINECELFIEHDGFIYSNRVNKNIDNMQQIRESRSKAGKISAEMRKNATNVEQTSTRVEQKLTNANKAQQNKIKEIKEKEIKEYKEEKNNIISSEPLQVSEQVIINFPTNRFNTINEEFAVTENYFNEMKNCYPAVDVISELNKMRAWLISNSEKRKTKQGMTKFINNWLSKRQDQGIKNEYNQKNIGNTAGSEYRTLPGGRVAANFTAEDYQSTWDG